MKCKYCKKGIIYKNNEWTHIKSNIPNCAGFMAEPENLSTSHNIDSLIKRNSKWKAQQ